MKVQEKVLIIGYGSIGKRYHDILKKKYNVYLLDKKLTFINPSKQKSLKSFLNLNVIKFCIICSPPETHIFYLNFFKKYKIPLLIEKPLILTKQIYKLEKIINYYRNKTVAVSSNIFFDQNFYKIYDVVLKNKRKIQNIKLEFKYNLKNMVGNYSKNKYYYHDNLGGGVILDCMSHEFQIFFKIFGKPKIEFLKTTKDKNNNYTQYMKLKVLFEKKIKISCIFDYGSKIRERSINILFKKNKYLKYIETNKPINKKILTNLDSKIKLKKQNSNIPYLNQLIYFEKVIAGKKKTIININDSLKLLKFIKNLSY